MTVTAEGSVQRRPTFGWCLSCPARRTMDAVLVDTSTEKKLGLIWPVLGVSRRSFTGKTMYIGPIQCPNCESPLDSNAFVCPYCQSTAAASAPWNKGAWSNVAILAGVVSLLGCLDAVLGMRILPAMWEWAQQSSD